MPHSEQRPFLNLGEVLLLDQRLRVHGHIVQLQVVQTYLNLLMKAKRLLLNPSILETNARLGQKCQFIDQGNADTLQLQNQGRLQHTLGLLLHLVEIGS